eukprot:1594713-Pyramimonas_sp.AAC.1
MDSAAESLRASLTSIEGSESGVCACCGKPIKGVSVFSADVDQAFEACESTRALPAWQRLAKKCESKTPRTS